MIALRWTVVSRFDEYVKSLPDGMIEFVEPAIPLTGGGAVFPLRSSDISFSFGGAYRLAGHGGMLYVSIAEPELTARGDRFEISIAGQEEGDGRFVLAEVEGSTIQDLQSARPRLTERGSELYFYRYPAGFELDPLAFQTD